MTVRETALPIFLSYLPRACLGKSSFSTYETKAQASAAARSRFCDCILFFEFSLCLSRACLGKMINFIYKWLKKRHVSQDNTGAMFLYNPTR